MGPFFSKARYMNGVGFEILARTPAPKLPLSYPAHRAPFYLTAFPKKVFLNFKLLFVFTVSCHNNNNNNNKF